MLVSRRQDHIFRVYWRDEGHEILIAPFKPFSVLVVLFRICRCMPILTATSTLVSALRIL
jgi:hypothetical protein